MVDYFHFLQLCVDGGGNCHTEIDGYYVESLICVVLGLLWLTWGKGTIKRLQGLPERAWQVIPKRAH
jgi:MFS transporter, PAT family, solute carrier family 33 (acetyl-CoA transportor), member 1